MEYVKYDVEGELYETKLGSYSTRPRVGSEIEILYDKDNPARITAKSFGLVMILIGLTGIFLIYLGVKGLFGRGIWNSKKERLRKNGEHIIANYVSTDCNEKLMVNDKHPYHIICEWMDPTDCKRYEFKSQTLWEDPQILIAERNISSFPVYRNKILKRQYVMDIDAILDDGK